jgi:hypothetical protein
MRKNFPRRSSSQGRAIFINDDQLFQKSRQRAWIDSLMRASWTKTTLAKGDRMQGHSLTLESKMEISLPAGKSERNKIPAAWSFSGDRAIFVSNHKTEAVLRSAC